MSKLARPFAIGIALSLSMLAATPRVCSGQSVAIEVAKLAPPDGGSGDRFGEAIAMDGTDLVVVGAPGHDQPAVDQGAVYLYSRSSTGWALDQKLVANDGASDDLFGAAVSVRVGTLIVGAPGHVVGGARTGAVYVFLWNGTDWIEHQKLIASDAANSGRFGASLDVGWDVLVIGAPGQNGKGAAYLFGRSGTQFVERSKHTASDGAAGDEYGFSVAADYWYITIGAPGDNDLGADSGSVYVYDGTPDPWSLRTKLTASNGAAGDLFGFSVSTEDHNTVVVGAPGDHHLGIDAGAVYRVHETTTLGWYQVKRRNPEQGAGDRFGCSVAVGSGPALWSLVVGAEGDDDGGVDAGAVHAFQQVPADWTYLKAARKKESAGDRFGLVVAAADDFIVVGAPGDDHGGPDVGAVGIHEVTDLYTRVCTGTSCGCPCNNPPPNWSYSGCANSTGLGAGLRAVGTQLVFRDDLQLKVYGGVPGSFGLFLQGRSLVTVPFKDGCLCAGNPTVRLGMIQLDSGGGASSTGISLVTQGAVIPGETIYYQLWYRDNTGPCGTGSNLTNGLGVTWR